MNIKRIINSGVALTIAGLAILNQWTFIILVCLLTVGGLYEFFYLIKKKDIPIYSYTGIFIGVLIPLSIFFNFELTRNWELLFIVCAFLLMLFLQFARQDNTNAIIGLSTTLFGVLYVSWFFSFIVKIRALSTDDWQGVHLVIFIVFVTKAADIGGFLIGSKFGKHPLLPKVSPNKSIEGTLGGILLSGIVAVALTFLLPAILQVMPVWYIFCIGLFFGSLGQLGDLSESMIKRDCNVKDSGSFLPGTGGILDMIDSLLFSVPAFYLFMSSTLTAVIKV